MSVFGILETLFIGPLKFAFEIIFSLALRFTGHPGIAIIALSLIMNILLLPLYKRADKIQEEARDTEEKLKDGVAHIKKTFSGNERMMILQTYYRQNNYKPSQAMNGSVSLLLEIPFFMAAYQFLSNLEIFNEASFGPIQNMGAPDGMLVIGGIVINLLPILMTAVNVISSAIYLKGFPLKTKIQLYAMAGFFLIFLYESPACLVFYWTLNNVFSLVKNIVEKIEHRKLILNVFLSLVGVFLIYYTLFVYDRHSIARTVLFVFAGLALQLPSVFSVIIKNREFNKIEYKTDKKFFFLCCLFITVLIGLLIPSALIASAPQDFIDTSYYFNPIIYIIHTLLMAIGMFVVWLGVFYKLADIKAKVIFEGLIWLLAGIMIVNYMFFGTEMGIISANLIYEHGLAITGKEALFNVIVIVAVSVILALFIWKFKQKLLIVILIALVTITGMSVMNINTINKSVKTLDIYMEKVRAIPSYNLSKDGQNVLVIMLDRAMGEYVPYIINEKPQLKESFDGFTYYNNVVSFGGHTNFGSPALIGGYEYTPVELNKRDDESLADKHNEALKVLPVLFSKNGFDVTVCDPPYAGYQYIPDLSIYDEYENIDVYISDGKFTDVENRETTVAIDKRNMFCYSIMKTVPLYFQPIIYNSGTYNYLSRAATETYTSQTMESLTNSTGIKNTFMKAYDVLLNLDDITTITSEDLDTYTFIANNITHEVMLLQAPEYVPKEMVNNEVYEAENKDRFTVDGKTLNMLNNFQYTHYYSNMAAFLVLGEYFDYLKANDVYNNTRIIITSDHGYNLEQLEDLVTEQEDMEYYFPLLMVKDFNETGFKVSNEFMTNADVPTLSVAGIIDNPVNPFTGKLLDNSEKYAHDQFVSLSHEWDINYNNGNTFVPSLWASINDNIWNKDNWKISSEETVLKEYVLP